MTNDNRLLVHLFLSKIAKDQIVKYFSQ